MYDIPTNPPPCGFKPCDHQSVSTQWNISEPVSYSHYDNRDQTKYWTTWAYNMGLGFYMRNMLGPVDLATIPESEIGPNFILDSSDYQRLTRIWDVNIKPRIKPTVDVLVFLAEFRDVTRLVKSLWRKIQTIMDVGAGASQLFHDWKRYNGIAFAYLRRHGKDPRGLLRIGIDEGLSSLSHEWLELNFALRPLVRDLLGILEAIVRFRARLEELIRGEKYLHKAYGSFSEGRLAPDDEILVCEPCSIGTCLVNNQVCRYPGDDSKYATCRGKKLRKVYTTSRKTRNTITVLYSYEVPSYMKGLEGSIRSLLSTLGIAPGLGTVWELIPFSFVVDWVFPIQGALDRFLLDPSPIKTLVHDVCFSKKEKYEYNLVGRSDCPRNAEQTLNHTIVDKYLRTVGAEHFTRMPFFKWPNWMQLSLGTALLKSKAPAHYRG